MLTNTLPGYPLYMSCPRNVYVHKQKHSHDTIQTTHKTNYAFDWPYCYYRKAILRILLRWWRSSSMRKLTTTSTGTCDRGRQRGTWSFHQYQRTIPSPSLNPSCCSISTQPHSAGELSIMQSSSQMRSASSAGEGRSFRKGKWPFLGMGESSFSIHLFNCFQFFWQTLNSSL